MNRNKKLSKTFLLVLLILVVASLFLIFKNVNFGPNGSELDEFAKCLAEKQITMYGTKSCAFCQREKNNFSSSFRFVSYIECSENTQLCLDQKINVVPTWVFPGGKRLEGEQGLEKLSKESGCPLPDLSGK